MGASAMLTAMKGWATAWAPHNLFGGIPGRHAEILHNILHFDWAASEVFALLSEDLEKAFDSVHPSQAIAIWRQLGAPLSLCRPMLNFYKSLQRVFSMRGALGSEWLQAVHSIIQGCPFSSYS